MGTNSRTRPGSTERRLFRELSGGQSYDQVRSSKGQREADRLSREAQDRYRNR